MMRNRHLMIRRQAFTPFQKVPIVWVTREQAYSCFWLETISGCIVVSAQHPHQTASDPEPTRMLPIRSKSQFVPILFAAVVLGCAENAGVAPKPGPATGSISIPIDALARARSDSLARGLAAALSDSGIRMRLRDDMRDSPFAMHALHLAGYLRGTAGAGMALRAARELGIGRDAFIGLVESGRQLELVMPRVLDRVSWDGGEDLDVAATQSKFQERKDAGRVSEDGFDTRGQRTTVRTASYSPRPYLIARPAS